MKPPLQVAVGIIFNDQQQILVAQRKKASHLQGYWEFPGGKLEPGEDSYQALCRELKEEIGIEVKTASPLTKIFHNYDQFDVNLHIWQVNLFTGQPKGAEGQIIHWIPLQELHTLELPPANQKLVAFLQDKKLGK